MRSLTKPMVIETDILASDQDDPSETHITVFTDDKIYDFRTRPDQMTIAFDRTTRRFQIARAAPPMQTSLTADDLIRFSAQLQTQAEKSSDPIVQFAASPKFEETYDAERGNLQLDSKPWKYNVQVQPIADAETRKRYRDFSDWFTYLNAMFRPLPPGARLELNRALDQHRVMPTAVEVTVQNRRTKIKQRSQHRLKHRIDPQEQALIDNWHTEQQTLPIVDFAKFRRGA